MKKSAESDSSTPPEFFLDRGLGKWVAAGLRELGWVIHQAVDHFPNDAQEIADEVWMRYGLERGWIPIHKDSRIRGREVERRPLVEFSAPMFYLDDQQLKIAQMVERFHSNQSKIYHLARRRRRQAACYAVTDHGVVKRWP